MCKFNFNQIYEDVRRFFDLARTLLLSVSHYSTRKKITNKNDVDFEHVERCVTISQNEFLDFIFIITYMVLSFQLKLLSNPVVFSYKKRFNQSRKTKNRQYNGQEI